MMYPLVFKISGDPNFPAILDAMRAAFRHHADYITWERGVEATPTLRGAIFCRESIAHVRELLYSCFEKGTLAARWVPGLEPNTFRPTKKDGAERDVDLEYVFNFPGDAKRFGTIDLLARAPPEPPQPPLEYEWGLHRWQRTVVRWLVKARWRPPLVYWFCGPNSGKSYLAAWLAVNRNFVLITDISPESLEAVIDPERTRYVFDLPKNWRASTDVDKFANFIARLKCGQLKINGKRIFDGHTAVIVMDTDTVPDSIRKFSIFGATPELENVEFSF